MPGKATYRNPWSWVSSLYLAEGLPYVVVMTVAVVMYKGMGISNAKIALYTSWLYLPWVIKPLWSPVVDILKTRRAWIWVMQLIIGAGLAGVALTLPGPKFFQYSLACFWILAFSSATQDIAIDGFYLLATTEKEQSFFVGIRSTFYRISMIFGQGILVILAGVVQDHTGLPKIDLQVAAKPGVEIIQALPQQPFAETNALSGELRILTSAETLAISPVQRIKAETKALLDLVHSNNVHFGFVAAEEVKSEPASAAKPDSPPEAPAPVVVAVTNKPVATPMDGNAGILALRLSQPPGKDVVVTVGSRVSFGFKASDDKSFSVAEGTRLAFNDGNWNKPAFAAVKLDPNLKTAANTVMEIRSGNVAFAWSVTFFSLAALFVVFSAYHLVILPHPVRDVPGSANSLDKFTVEFGRTFLAFFEKERIGLLLLFLLFYRFAEAQLVKMVVPFLLDAREKGGLGLTTSQVGFVYGTIGVCALTCGGLLGGMLAARKGLKFWLWWMVLAIHLPDAVFVYLSYAQPDNFWVINLALAVEQFGYGFGFTAYMLYMIYIARGKHATAHYAICTGFMALGMMLPGFWSGWLQQHIGYQHFFAWVLAATIPGFLVVAFIPLDAEFGKKTE